MNAKFYHKGIQPNTTIEDRKVVKEYHDAEIALNKELEKFYKDTAIARDIANVKKGKNNA